MNNVNYFRDLFESIPHYRKIVLLLFLNENDKDLLKEVGFSENDINRLSLQCRNILIEQHELYMDYVKNEEDSIIQKFPNK